MSVHKTVVIVAQTAIEQFGSLDRIRTIAKLGVYIATTGEKRIPPRIVLGVSSVPLGMPVNVELVLEIES